MAYLSKQTYCIWSNYSTYPYLTDFDLRSKCCTSKNKSEVLFKHCADLIGQQPPINKAQYSLNSSRNISRFIYHYHIADIFKLLIIEQCHSKHDRSLSQ